MSTTGMNVSRTYPIATSPKGADHSLVESKFLKELLALRSGKLTPFFYRITNKIVYVHSDIYCISADQPERRTNLMLYAGNSVYHKRFGYVFDYIQCQDVIKSCDKCTDGILKEAKEYDKNGSIRSSQRSLWRRFPCTKCTSWMYFDDSPLLSYIPEKTYPVNKLDETGRVMLSRITKTMLEQMIKDVEQAIVDKEWTLATCRSYLRTAGLHTKAVNNILDAATNYSIYLEAERNKDTNFNNWLILKKDRDTDPTKYELWTLNCMLTCLCI
jgi:hypothetical protein